MASRPSRSRSGHGNDCAERPGAEGEPAIGPSGAVRVLVATKSVDSGKGIEGPATLVRESMGGDPFSGCLCVPGQAGGPNEAGVLGWNGLCLFAKRLEDGILRWPKIEDRVMGLSAAHLSALLEGLD
ncbi:transposase [Bradyrhizobium sp. 177]|uniref:transposase n=1 Tax=Bradyrhizobium sp. 177 TaxID=2782647 RepID=UPI001FFC0235|nr:transposase [Bradyrhizobium sp. 177]